MESFITAKILIRAIVFVTLFATGGKAFAESVLTLLPNGVQFDEISQALKEELSEDITFEDFSVNKNTTVAELSEAIDKVKPKAIVIVGNTSVNLYVKYQKANKGEDFPPSIAVAALFLDKLLPKIENAAGIRYEIPLVTSAVNIRSLLSKDIKKIGVLHRNLMDDFIKINSQLASAEGIELVPLSLQNKSSDRVSSVKSKLNAMMKMDIDALWVINDNNLLNSATLSKSWIPVMKETSLPVIVGIESLLNSKLQFGNFAVVPDHYGLGEQTASMLIDVMDNEWLLGDVDLEQPLSVIKMVNVSLLEKKGIAYDKNRLSMFDEVVK